MMMIFSLTLPMNLIRIKQDYVGQKLNQISNRLSKIKNRNKSKTQAHLDQINRVGREVGKMDKVDHQNAALI